MESAAHAIARAAGAAPSHTPGPWVWDGDTLRPANPDPSTHHVHTILTTDGGYGFLSSRLCDMQGEQARNRELIRFAPTLLAALRILYAACRAMDLDDEQRRPSEDQYQGAMLAAWAAIGGALAGDADQQLDHVSQAPMFASPPPTARDCDCDGAGKYCLTQR